MNCKLCGADRKLIRDRVLPEAFFRIGSQHGAEALVMASSNPGIPPKRWPIGVYDPDLVCGDCEGRFRDWDTYAADLFINRFDTSIRTRVVDGETLAFVADDVDYERLKLFVVSVLWRAAASTEEYFKGVGIGPYEDAAKTEVLSANPGDPQEFGTIFSRWLAPPERESLTNAHMSPFCEKWDGINAVRIHIGPVVAYVKVDKHPYGDSFAPLLLTPGRPLTLVARGQACVCTYVDSSPLLSGGSTPRSRGLTNCGKIASTFEKTCS